MPNRLEELEEEYEREQSKSGGRKDLVATAKTYEGSGSIDGGGESKKKTTRSIDDRAKKSNFIYNVYSLI